ncbi:MAG: YhfC family intramembrane metalloprotease [Clostridia bacterium]|nr:YhfC family intramembrane metalloprotease [Clostridia bacterium]
MSDVTIGTAQFVWLALEAVIAIAVPVAIAIIWMKKKNEPVTSVLIGAAAFLLFVLILEKPIQNVLLFPTAMGLKDHALSRFMSERPILLSFLAGLFPGVFEETGRFVAYKTLLRKRKNRETSISYGIGHGGFEVIYLLGVASLQYILYAILINTGLFGTIMEQVAEQAPDQVSTLEAVVDTIAAYSLAEVGVALFERVFAVMFHIGASILVFYSCKEGRRVWLYLLAIVLHTVLDFIAALCLFNVISLPVWALEGIVAGFGMLVFFGSYFLLYAKDRRKETECDELPECSSSD